MWRFALFLRSEASPAVELKYPIDVVELTFTPNAPAITRSVLRDGEIIPDVQRPCNVALPYASRTFIDVGEVGVHGRAMAVQAYLLPHRVESLAYVLCEVSPPPVCMCRNKNPALIALLQGQAPKKIVFMGDTSELVPPPVPTAPAPRRSRSARAVRSPPCVNSAFFSKRSAPTSASGGFSRDA